MQNKKTGRQVVYTEVERSESGLKYAVLGPAFPGHRKRSAVAGKAELWFSRIKLPNAVFLPMLHAGYAPNDNIVSVKRN
jgi:hypothetical protein